MARGGKRDVVLITDAPENPDKERRRRELRYVIMMGTRALCLIGAAILVSTKPPLLGLWLGLCLFGMVVLPWLAVLLANDRPAKTRAQRQAPTASIPEQAALPAPTVGAVIDEQ